MHAFSEVLSGIRVNGALFFNAEFSAPWRLSTPHSERLASMLAPGAQQLVVYHLVVDGSARARLDDGPDVELSPGDIVVFAHGDPHHLSGGSGANQVDSAAVSLKVARRDISPMRAGEGGRPRLFPDASRWRRRNHPVRLWVPDLRSAPRRADSREPAADAEGERQDRSLRSLAGAIDPASGGGGRLGPRRERGHVREALRGAVRGHVETIRCRSPGSDDGMACRCP